MGNKPSPSYSVPIDDYTTLRAKTKFTRAEIDYLYKRFRELGEPSERKRHLIKMDFNFPSHTLHDLILKEMFGEKNRIDFVEFATFLNMFRALEPNTSNAQRQAMKIKKLRLLFSMYDTNKNGEISKHELLDIVHRLFGKYTNIQTMVQIVNVVMKEMDQSNINRILFDDFCKALEPFDMELLAIRFPGS